MTAAFITAIFLISLTAQHTMVMFHAPRWSPDGRWLVLSSNVDGPDEEIWLVSADRKIRRKLTDNDVADTSADWHPDGKRVVFRRGEDARMVDLVINTDGSNVMPYEPKTGQTRGELTVEERLTSGGQDVIIRVAGQPERRISQIAWAEQPSISPDGRFVAWEQRQDPHDILSSNIAVWESRTGNIRIVAQGTDPSWSPDGRLLLFKAPDKNNALFITTVLVATGERRTLAPGVHPHFSPDGTMITYMADRPDRADVYVMHVDGSERRCITCDWK